MANPITGKGGTITYAGGHVETINTWSIDVGTDTHDVTSFTTSLAKWREFIAGLSSWTGSIEGVYDPTSTGQQTLLTNTLAATTGTVVFELDQTLGGKFTGNVIIDSMGLNVDIGSPIDASWSVQGSGEPVFSTST